MKVEIFMIDIGASFFLFWLWQSEETVYQYCSQGAKDGCHDVDPKVFVGTSCYCSSDTPSRIHWSSSDGPAFFIKKDPKNATVKNASMRSRFWDSHFQLKNCTIKYAALENVTWGRVFVTTFSVENLHNVKCDLENATWSRILKPSFSSFYSFSAEIS